MTKDKDGFFNPPESAIYVINLDRGEAVSAGGIIISDDHMKERGIRPRWAQVWKVGKDWEEDFKPGQWVLLEHGNWSNIIELENDAGEKIDMQVIEEKSIKRGALAIQDEKPEHMLTQGLTPI